MPINCPGNSQPRYRVKGTEGKNIRLAFCGNKVVEAKHLKKKAKAKKSLDK